MVRTRSTSYTVSLLPDGSGLVLDGWGPESESPPEPWGEPERTASWAAPADSAPLEFASAGQRHVAFSELLVDRGDSETGAAWQALPGGVDFSCAESGDRLAVAFRDERGELELTLRFATDRRHDVVRRSMSLVNLSASRGVTLSRAFSAGWNVPLGRAAHIDYLAGTWADEFNLRSVELDGGTLSIGSRQGMTGMLFSPVVTVTAAADANSFARPQTDAWGVALAWSGSWRLQVDTVAVGQSVRVSCGLDEDTTTVTLLPGESFESPESLGVYSVDGADGVTAAWHRYHRTLARDLGPQHRPVVYNSWYATEFDVRPEQQLALAEAAAELGVETFVVDDGWFAGRHSSREGLGDWRADPEVFPNGIGELADAVVAKGLRFGLWVEPEGVNPDSDLYRAHPDWIYRDRYREPLRIRNQYVLDLGRAEVVEWVEQTLRDVLGSAPISYLKWDMNRPITDGGRPGDPHGRQWSLAHTRGYYRVLEMLRREFPDVTVEACASGGARIDNAVLARADVVWTSDEVGPRDRLLIQHGFLSAYPAYVMSSWVADEVGHRDRGAASLGFRFAVAMAGVLGIGSDITRWSPEERRLAAACVELYKELRPVIHGGDAVRHGVPGEPGYAVEYALGGRHPIVLFVYDRDRDRTRDRERVRVFPTQLVDGARYRVRGTEQMVTAATAAAGIVVPFALASDADVIVLDCVD